MISNNQLVTDSGDTFIPASQRPDGTWRKARRVKEGYVPQEEVPLYESKGKQFMNRTVKPEPVKLTSGESVQRPIPGLFIFDDKDKFKQAKKKNKKVEEVTKKLEQTTISVKPQIKVQSQEQPQATEPAKKLKNLKKRLREVEALEEKLKSGALTKPEPEQLTKIKRKKELLVQIRELEKELEH